jgi:Raf kinase inhibitor-like YbhB/YbcL family protein
MRFLIGSSVLLSAALAGAAPAKLTVMSDAFAPTAAIPIEYTCDGAARAPMLTWSAVPAGTRSIAILIDDPDSERGAFTHLLVTNLPPDLESLDLGTALPADASVTRNDSGATGYLAPCPQDGTHHYHYRVYALDARIARAPATRAVTRAAFLRGITGHVLAEGELVGVYAAR